MERSTLEIRGPGELLGVQQHGMWTYRFANLIGDAHLVVAAQQDALSLILKHTELNQKQKELLEDTRYQYTKSRTCLLHVA